MNSEANEQSTVIVEMTIKIIFSTWVVEIYFGSPASKAVVKAIQSYSIHLNRKKY